jgi:hypothetical protein
LHEIYHGFGVVDTFQVENEELTPRTLQGAAEYKTPMLGALVIGGARPND